MYKVYLPKDWNDLSSLNDQSILFGLLDDQEVIFVSKGSSGEIIESDFAHANGVIIELTSYIRDGSGNTAGSRHRFNLVGKEEVFADARTIGIIRTEGFADERFAVTMRHLEEFSEWNDKPYFDTNKGMEGSISIPISIGEDSSWGSRNIVRAMTLRELSNYINSRAHSAKPVCVWINSGHNPALSDLYKRSIISITNGKDTLNPSQYQIDGFTEWRVFLSSYGRWQVRMYDPETKKYAVKTIDIAFKDEYGEEPPDLIQNITIDDNDFGPEIGREGGLNAYTWAEIAQISEMGLADLYFSVGDTHSVTVNGTVGSTTISDKIYYAYILGFNHDITEGENRPSGITFGTFASSASITTSSATLALTSSSHGSSVNTSGNKLFSMNHCAATAKGGWGGCDLRYDILGSTHHYPTYWGSTSTTADRVGTDPTYRPMVTDTLFNAMLDVHDFVKPIITYSNIDGGTTASSVQKTIDYLPLLSVAEVFGKDGETNPFINDKVKQYEFYTNGNSKKKMKHSSTSSIAAWYLRDAYSATSFRCVSSDSTPKLTYISGNIISGIAPKFKI